LIQSDRQRWKKIKQAIGGCAKCPGKVEICFLTNMTKGNEPLYLVVKYFDDGGLVQTPEAIYKVFDDLGKSIKVKTVNQMKKIAGCVN
jgi:hypothetical protein